MANACPEHATWSWTFEHQWDLSDRGCTEVDADAVGIGVVVAFIISASVLVLVIFVAFLWDSIPTDLLNDVDRHIIETISIKWMPTNWMPLDRRRKHRVDAVIKFLLSLADQQMVSAFALLIAAYANWNSILVYSMSVTSSLTLLASSVYVPVFPIVTFRDRQLMRDKRKPLPEPDFSTEYETLYGLAKHLRFFITVVNFVGMAFLFVMSFAHNWWPEYGNSDLYFLPGLHHYNSNTDLVALLNYFILLNFAFGYLDVAVCLYTGTRYSFVDWVAGQFETPGGDRPELEDYLASKARVLQRRIEDARRPAVDGKYRWELALLDESYAFNAAASSFALNSVISVYFAFIYGILDIFMSRDWPMAKNGVSGNPNTWSFGQIVPMILLLLPILAVSEASYDYKAVIKRPQTLFNASILSAQQTASDINIDPDTGPTEPASQQGSANSPDNQAQPVPENAVQFAIQPPSPSASYNDPPEPSASVLQMASFSGEAYEMQPRSSTASAITDDRSTRSLVQRRTFTFNADNMAMEDGNGSNSPTSRRISFPTAKPVMDLNTALAILQQWQNTTDADPLRYRNIAIQTYLHLLIILAVDLSLAINAGLSNLNNRVVFVLARIAFGYDTAFTLRAAYSWIALRFYVKEPQTGFVQRQTVSWMPAVAKTLCVLTFAACSIAKAVVLPGMERVVEDVFWTSMGPCAFVGVGWAIAWWFRGW